MGKEKKMNNEKRFNSPLSNRSSFFRCPLPQEKYLTFFFGKNKSQKGAKYIIQQK